MTPARVAVPIHVAVKAALYVAAGPPPSDAEAGVDDQQEAVARIGVVPATACLAADAGDTLSA